MVQRHFHAEHFEVPPEVTALFPFEMEGRPSCIISSLPLTENNNQKPKHKM